jgi:uncharacterized membrane protein YhaH (DUF805 family)
MNWTWYLFRFDGRVGRAGFWCSFIFVVCGMILLLFLCAGLMLAIAGKVPSFELNADDVFRFVDPATYRGSLLDNQPLLLIELVATSLLLWI